MNLLQDIVIILSAAIVIIVLFSKLKIPSVVGFLLTGIIIGPYSTRLIQNTQDIEILAEIGVVLMMFIIGIEFSIKRLNRIKKLIIIGGGGQVIFTIIVVAAVSLLFNFSFQTGIFFGFLVSLSSTAIVLKLMQEKRQLDSPQGKIELGILLFQDLCVVPMVILTPILSLNNHNDFTGSVMQIVIAFASINVIFFAARKLMPYILHIIVKTRLKEIFIISSLFLCIGMAFLTNYLGLSLALGAFIAGLIISESRYSHQVVADILPFKESFNSIFFISVGMLLDLNYASANIWLIASLAFGIIILKSFVILVLVLLLKYPFRTSVFAAMGLAQAGEFSFVLAKLGLQYSLITADTFQVFLSAAILTMIFTPFTFILSPIVVKKTERRSLIKSLDGRKLHKSPGKGDSDKTTIENHVIIVGYGLNGRNIASVMRRRQIPYVIIELNPDNVIEAERKNETVVYGDATRTKILEEAFIKTARVITFAISDPFVIDHAVASARFLSRDIFIIARTKYVSEIDRLYEAGADTVFAEEYETSIEILASVMMQYGFSKEAINREITELHKRRYGLIRNSSGKEKIDEESAAGRVHQKLQDGVNIDSFTITKMSSSAGKSINELGIRTETGATIISVIRHGENIPNPQPDFRFNENDTVLLMGSFEQVEKAIEYLR